MSWVHDNIILSYNVDFKSEVLVIKTEYHVREICEDTDVIFTGFLTHDFKHVMKGSMILDIEEYPLDRFLEESRELLEENKNCLWPFPVFDICKEKYKEKVTDYIQTNQYKVFLIYSSMGLNGWVLAKQMDIFVNGQLICDE